MQGDPVELRSTGRASLDFAGWKHALLREAQSPWAGFARLCRPEAYTTTASKWPNARAGFARLCTTTRYLPWPPEAPWPAEELPAEEDEVVPVLAAAAGAELTLGELLDIAPEYPPDVFAMPGKLLPPL